MIIQGAHMNYGFMQKMMAEQNREDSYGSRSIGSDAHTGLHLGQYMTVNPAKAGLTPAREALLEAPGQAGKLSEDFPDTVGKAFANEIMRRMGEVTGEDGQPKDSTDLRQSLGSTMDWIRERYGEETAAAAAGMIIQATSSGVTEETLGNGLLNTLKFIDRNFGIAAGDEAIAQFNNGINGAVNEFFDNGLNELFFAAESSDGSTAGQDLNARFISQVAAATDTEDNLDQLTDILDELKGELDKIGELNDLVTQLEADFSPARTSPEAALAAYEAAPDTNQPQLASLTV
jgi:hypothetical protein